MHLRRTPLLLIGAGAALLGGVFLVLPPALGDLGAPALAGDSSLAVPTLPTANPALAEDVVLANVFSPRRTPPASRYTPPDAALDSSGGVVADSVTHAAPMPEVPSSDPVLLGTVVGPGGTQALLQLDPLNAPARLYSVGDRDGGYRLISIAPRAVTLAGPRGRMILRLAPPEGAPKEPPPDPQEERP